MVKSGEPAPSAGLASFIRAATAAKLLMCFLPALSAISCGAAGRPAGGIEGGGVRDGGGGEAIPIEAGEREPSLDEQEIAEYLRENPGDPSRAGLEQILSAPAIADDPARRGDYRRREHPRSVGAVCRITQETISPSGASRFDGYLAADAGGWKALCRARKTESGGSAGSWYLAGEALSGAVRLHGGAMVPDFALGLAFGGSGGSSLSSSAFPFHTPRMIAGTASFSAQSLQGGAAEIRGRRAYAAAFWGRPVTYGPDGPESAGTTAAGARIEARRGRAEAGLSFSSGARGSGTRVIAVDGRWKSDGLNAGFEAGWGDAREPALLSAFSCGISKTRAGLMLYFVPPGAAGPFGSMLGRSPGRASSIGGAAVAFERAIQRRIRVRASLDRSERADGLHAAVRQTARIECERRGKALFLRLVWTGATDERLNSIPCPPAAEIRLSGSHALGIQAEWRIAGNARVGAVLKRVDDEGGLGWLVAPVLRASLLSDRLRLTASFAEYETPRGNPVCYFYEPSLQGSFPLRIASRNTRRGSIVIGIYINKLKVFARAALETGKSPDISLQAMARL
jgi:hypothetical protein